ncbi:MAG: hypothetical protein AAF745_10005, partial [Planctomycetota bacterium]
MRRPDPDEEFALTSLKHEISGQRYQVAIEEDEIIHAAWKTFRGTKAQLPIASEPVKYVVGSGAFAKSYLYADGDALMQMPLSYYINHSGYGMSPGYDLPQHAGFNRQISDQCLFCHVGQIERRDGNPNHTTIVEMAISCERCHGPGQDHVS